MPIGFGPDDTNDKRLVNLFYSVPEKRLSEIQNGTLEKWKDEVLKLDKISLTWNNIFLLKSSCGGLKKIVFRLLELLLNLEQISLSDIQCTFDHF